MEYLLMRNGALVFAVLGCALLLIGCEPPDAAQRVEAELAAQLLAQEVYTAPEPPPPAVSQSPIDELNASLENLRAKVTAEVPPAEASTHTSQSEDSRYEELQRELDELRAEVKRLQDTVDLTVSYVVGDLQEENRRLREEIARAYTTQPSGAVQAPSDPGPRDAQLSPQAVEALAAMAGEQVNYGEKEYLAVKEWGRSPEEVKNLPDGVPSLRGLICAIAPGLSDADISDLGRRIRAECDVYDNVMIEVFDNEAAARAYADQNIRSTSHNVLSIQKDGATNQDTILLHRHGVSIQVPR
ncbi:MAG: hypothetical protein IT365_15410 [Candidatus Hydrogenedentes bacterium]|nr:hypothetical protein [Candidatus Hydrogenedentota bacterium]